jgi:DNA polymerase III alpha subunit (gram-positive type)
MTEPLLEEHACTAVPQDKMDDQANDDDVHHPIKISTLVFFDLETTGLIEKETFPEISELACVAVQRGSLENPAVNHTPRILDKLRLTLRPTRALSYQTTFITGKPILT